MTDQKPIPLRKLQEILTGKLIKVDDFRGSSLVYGTPCGICSTVHRASGGGADAEFLDGRFLGFTPCVVESGHVAGLVDGEADFVRNFTVVNPLRKPWEFKITGGPSREAIFDSLRLREHNLLTHFTLEDCHSFSAVVKGIERVGDDPTEWRLLFEDPPKLLLMFRIEALYRVSDRTGLLTMERQFRR